MAIPKIVWESKKDSSETENKKIEDKKKVEALIKRLNEKIQKDQQTAKKAALIIEQWLKKPKP